MITFLRDVQREVFAKLCGLDPVLGTRMHTQLQIYGTGSGLADQWIMWEDDGETPTAALQRFGGRLTVTAEIRADARELASFAGIAGGVRLVEGSPEICRALQRHLSGSYTGYPTMIGQCNGEGDASPGGDILTEPSLEGVYRLLCTEDAELAGSAPWDTWYPHTSHLVRHGLGAVAALCRDGQLACTGGVYASNEGFGLIGSIVTAPRYRGCGLASSIVRFLCGYCSGRGIRPVLISMDAGLVGFYQRLGFSLLGEMGSILLE